MWYSWDSGLTNVIRAVDNWVDRTGTSTLGMKLGGKTVE